MTTSAARTLTVTTPSEREILITRAFDAPRTLVFDCLSKPELVSRWLVGPGWTMPVCEIDFKVGGRFRYVWRRGGKDMGMGGVFQEIVRPLRIVQTELFDEDWTGGEARSTLLLTEERGRTTLAINVLYSSKQARDGALATGMLDGMTATYDELERLLAALQARA